MKLAGVYIPRNEETNEWMYSDDQEAIAISKMMKIAFSYQGVRGFLNPGVSILGAFTNPMYLTPAEFREQVLVVVCI